MFKRIELIIIRVDIAKMIHAGIFQIFGFIQTIRTNKLWRETRTGFNLDVQVSKSFAIFSCHSATEMS